MGGIKIIREIIFHKQFGSSDARCGSTSRSAFTTPDDHKVNCPCCLKLIQKEKLK